VLCGPDTKAWAFDLEPGRAIAGVRIRPGACGAVFGVGADELVDRRVALADVLGASVERRLVERLAAAATVGARLDAVEATVRRHRRSTDRSADRVAELAAVVAADPGHGAATLAADAGLSPRQLRRHFERGVGYGPAFFARVARLQRFARVAARRPDQSLAEMSAAAGYADQSHLARDTRDITGRTPRALVACLAATSVAVDLGDGRSVQDEPIVPARRSAA